VADIRETGLTPASTSGTAADRAAAAVVFCLTLAVYAWSAPRTVMLDDDGYFILAAWFNGVAHPPGYPVYTVLAHVATWLPVGSVAFRVHLLSGVLGAAACACLCIFLRRLGTHGTCAVAAAVAYGFSAVFWSQAIVAEVYTLNALFFFALLAAAPVPRATATGERPASATVVAFVYGLSLSNHWPLMLLATPGLALMYWPLRREFLRRLPATIGFFLLGLVPYLWMVFRSQASEIAFYGSIDDLRDFWFYVSREPYSDTDVSGSADWGDRLAFGGLLFREAVLQFGYPGAVLGALGFWRQWRSAGPRIGAALLLAFLGQTLVLIALLSFDYDLVHVNAFRVYPMVAWGIAAIWLGLGLQWLVEWISTRARGAFRPAFLRSGLALTVGATVWFVNVPANYQARNAWAEEYGRVILETLPPNAKFFAFGDYVTGPVGYLNLIMGLRPDVELYTVKGLLFRTRLFDTHPEDPEVRARAIDAFIRSTTAPVLYAFTLPHRYSFTDYGLYLQVDRGRDPAINRTVLVPRIRRYFETVLDRGAPADPSQYLHHQQLTAQYCSVIASLRKYSTDPGLGPERDVERRCDNFQGFLQRARVELAGSEPDTERVLMWLDRAERYAEQAGAVDSRGAVDYFRGRAYLQMGDRVKARGYLLRSMSIWSSGENASLTLLRELETGNGKAGRSGAKADPVPRDD
jgi:hypothetical protein